MKHDLKKRKKLTTLLGLTLDGSRLEGVVLRRTNGSLAQLQKFSAQLALDPLTAAPELVGREIRNHLDAAGVREKNCVAGLPLRWLLTAQTELPAGLPDADAESLLQLEAEKNFHADTESLQISASRCALAGDKKYVLLAGMPNTHVGSLEQVLAAAKLKPVGMALGICALEKSAGSLALVIGENSIGLQVNAGGGVAALRALEGAVENVGGRATLQAGVVSREARITLGQLPPELRDEVKRIRIFGPRDLARELADEMELRFEPLGLKTEVVAGYAADEFGVTLPAEVFFSPAFSLAADFLVQKREVFDFLPPKPNVLEQLLKKYTSGKFGTAGAVAACAVVILLGIFLFQQLELWHYRSQWAHMEKRVADLQNISDEISFYHPWYDETYPGLTILQQLTLAFPENGSVTAKTIEVRDGSTVSCSGNASDNAALISVLGNLRKVDGVRNLKLDQIRGKSPMQFTFDFEYGNGGAK
ncbi:MAG TPA: hypothetical protein VK742_17775 [Candidatus Sulfotelmatobacter sp.]|jgi:hypothetical protein|nr:hypothetical protein [Candidatus Sulfotelmatobacter sp.]